MDLETPEMSDSLEDWTYILKKLGRQQMDLIGLYYPEFIYINVEFKDLLSCGEIGRRVAKHVLKSPRTAMRDANDAIICNKLVSVTKTFTPKDLRVNIRNIPEHSLELNSDLKEVRADSRTKAWRGAVRVRDEFTCRKCRCTYREIQVHHIIPVNVDPSLAWDINNGITLCRNCHSEFHSKYGTGDIGHYEIHEFIRGESS